MQHARQDTGKGAPKETLWLSDADLDRIANAAAEKAAKLAVAQLTNEIYRQVGKSVIEKLFYIIGVLAVGVYAYWQSGGFPPAPK